MKCVDGGLEFRLLGPVGIWAGARRLGPSAAQQRTVLATLLLDSGRVVSIDRLVSVLWGTAPPAVARNAVQGCVSHIRRLMATNDLSQAGVDLITSRQGYCLVVEPSMVDLHSFRELVREAGKSDPATACDLLSRGLERWRGPALADVAGSWLCEAVAPRLEEERLAALEQRFSAELRLGRHHEIVEELSTLVAEFPLRERLVLTLLTTLHRCGRRVDALARFREIRQRFVDDLGIEPGAELQRAHQAVLQGQEQAMHNPPPPPWQPVHQLPAVTPRFVGRRPEIDRLDAEGGSGIWVVSGTAGVGKTTLAVHWAQRVRHRFPDGQLYLNLRGYDPAGPPTSPADALPLLLQTLHTPPEQIPSTLEAQVAAYRSILAGRRMLIVLDNARSADQVRPLLPGVSHCMVVITSRAQLISLVAIEGANPLPLDLLSADEARELLARRLGAERVAAQPRAVDDIIARCARLPLALAIVAARAATHPGFALERLAGEPREPRTDLDAFDSDDHTSVRAVFSWSYQTLSADAARLFRLLGLHPGPDIAAPAAASLAGMSPGQVRPLLAELARTHMITEHAPGRYAVHDLLRAYAAELAHIHDRDTDHRAATHRVLDHYLHTAHSAHRLLRPQHDPIAVSEPQSGVTPEWLIDHTHAMAWFNADHAVLVAAIAHAAKDGFEAHAWQLAWTLTEFFARQGHWHDWVATHSNALEAAGRQADRLGRAHTHRGLAIAHARLSQNRDAHAHFDQALQLFVEIGDQASQGHTHLGIGWLRARQNRHSEALHHARRALDLYRATGNQASQAKALNAVGWYHAQLGDYQQTLVHCERALRLLRDSGEHRDEAGAWDSLGYAHLYLGHYEQAISCCQHAVDLYRNIGDRYLEADALAHLGDAHHATGDDHIARETWRQALTIFNELSHPDADRLHAKLEHIGTR